jgi:hypothetical protein
LRDHIGVYLLMLLVFFDTNILQIVNAKTLRSYGQGRFQLILQVQVKGEEAQKMVSQDENPSGKCHFPQENLQYSPRSV